MTDKVLTFPAKKKRTLAADDVLSIEFITDDERLCYVNDPDLVRKIMIFVCKEKIKITDGNL